MGTLKQPRLLKTTCCSLQTEDKPIQLTEHGKVDLVPTLSLHPYVLVSLVQDGTLYTAEKHTQQAIPKPFDLQGSSA